MCLVFSKISHVESLDGFRKSGADKVKLDINILMKQKNYKEEKTRIEYANKFIKNMVLGEPTTCFYQVVFDKYESIKPKII